MNKYVTSAMVGFGMLTTGIGAVAINDSYQHAKISDLKIELYEKLNRSIAAADDGMFFLDKREYELAGQELKKSQKIGSGLKEINDEIKYREGRIILFFKEKPKQEKHTTDSAVL